MSTIIYCDENYCVNNTTGKCELSEISIMNGHCSDFDDITDGEDYQHEYYKSIKHRAEDRVYKRKCRGKRIEHEEFVFYTSGDLRNGFTGLTEEKSGVLAIQICDLKNKNKMNEMRNALAKYFETHKSIIEYDDIFDKGGLR